VAGPERIVGAFSLRPGEKVLEIGPGTGFYSLAAARRVGTSGRLICLDIQPEMLRETRRRTTAAGLAADFIQADAAALPLRSGALDHAYLITVLGEIPDRRAALAEIKRVLRPAGRLSISEQFPDPDFVTRRTLRHALDAAGFVEEATHGRLIYMSTWSSAAPSRAEPRVRP
jgi:ubiquinone/menaquinone biosynthesis C-methylase UbiE